MHRALFKPNQIVRYGSGPTELMEILYRRVAVGAKCVARYYGTGFHGSPMSAPHEGCVAASHADIKLWNAQSKVTL